MAVAEKAGVPAAGEGFLRRGRRHPIEGVVKVLLILAALVSVATTIAIIIALVEPAIEFFREVSVVEFLRHEWTRPSRRRATASAWLSARGCTVSPW